MIVTTPGVRSGQPRIDGTRITVFDVLDWLADGMTHAEIMEEHPEVTVPMILASLSWAASLGERMSFANAG